LVMPRRARIVVAGLPFHILQRGNNRAACFVEQEDRASYLFQLRRHLRSTGILLHAYCLMTNHVHLLVTPVQADSCARLMKAVNQLHSQYMNRRYGRTGTLWEGRFKSCPIEAETYLLNCYRYIELNPVRAGIVDDPAAYPWSSYNTNAGDVRDEFLSPHEVFVALGDTATARRAIYIALLRDDRSDGPTQEIRKATSGNLALGSNAFARRLAALTGRRATPGRNGRPPQTTKAERTQLSLLAAGE
jgi:putative transposase